MTDCEGGHIDEFLDLHPGSGVASIIRTQTAAERLLRLLQYQGHSDQ